MPEIRDRGARVQTLVLASGNAGKLREFSGLLGTKSFTLITQTQLGIAACPEPHATFIENALEKARHASRNSGHPALADDSGICVPMLGGAPGVLSARYAQSEGFGSLKQSVGFDPLGQDGLSIDEQNNYALQLAIRSQLVTSDPQETPAYYYCVLVLIRHEKDPQPIIASGTWHGALISQPRGDGGFGYDPYFFIANENQTVAQMSAEKKNRLSHRAQALRALMEQLR